MNLKRCSDEKLARMHKNNLKRRDIEMQDYNESSNNSDFDEPEDIVESTYQCPGCGDEWVVVTMEDGIELELNPDEECCTRCGTRGLQL